MFFAFNDWPLSSLPIEENFIGRQSEIDEIFKSFREGKTKLVILNSCPGNGKTSLAKQVGLRFSQEISKLVYFFNANDIEKEMISFSLKFTTNGDSRQENFEHISTIMSQSQNKILLILDDCLSPHPVYNYLKMCRCENVFMIVTTRNENFNGIYEITKLDYEVKLLNASECYIFLKSNLKIDQVEIYKLLNKFRLNGDQRPETLNKLVTYLKLKIEKNITIQQIIDSSDDKIFKEFNQNVNQSLFTEISLQNENAWEILKYMSVLDFDFVSLSILKKILNWQGFDKDIAFLISLSIVKNEIRENVPGIKINGNLSQETNHYLGQDEKNQILKAYSKGLFELFKNSDELQNLDLTNKLHYYQFQKLIRKIKECPIIDNNIKSSIECDFAELNYTSLDFELAIDCYKDALDQADKEDLSKALILDKLGKVYSDFGEYDKAYESLDKSLKIKNNLDQNGDLNLAVTLNDIANVFYKKREYHKSIEFFNESLKHFKTNQEFYLLKNNIGLCYYGLKEYEKALNCFQESLATIDDYDHKEKSDYYLDKAKCLHSIGKTYSNVETKGNFKIALNYYYEARENYVLANEINGIYHVNEDLKIAHDMLIAGLTETNREIERKFLNLNLI